MKIEEVIENIKTEFVFETSRSSGKGGQHVNKTESRVTLVWKYIDSAYLTQEMIAKLLVSTNAYISKSEIRVSSEKSRSQFKNKEDAISKLNAFLIEFFKEKKKRKPTKVPKAVVKKRLQNKADKGKLKETRKKINVKRLPKD